MQTVLKILSEIFIGFKTYKKYISILFALIIIGFSAYKVWDFTNLKNKIIDDQQKIIDKLSIELNNAKVLLIKKEDDLKNETFTNSQKDKNQETLEAIKDIEEKKNNEINISVGTHSANF